jgi:hypothetical protein
MTSSTVQTKSRKPRGPTAKVLPGIYHDKMPPFSSEPLNAPTGKMVFPTSTLLATKAMHKPDAKVRRTKAALWGSSGKKITNESKRPIIANPEQKGPKSAWHGGVSRLGTHVAKDNCREMHDPSNHVWTSKRGQEVLNLSPNLPGKRTKKAVAKAKLPAKGRVSPATSKPKVVAKAQPPAAKPTPKPTNPLPQTLPQPQPAPMYVSPYGFLNYGGK